MDPVVRVWMFENWLGDQKDDAELAKNHAYLLASFWNPEAVKQILGGTKHISTDEEFEESSRIVKEMDLSALSSILGPPAKEAPIKKNKRRKLKNQ